jgi:NADH-quinone oxidoreductase subunit C/D
MPAEKTVSAPLAPLTPEMQQLQDRFGDAVKPAEYQGVVISNDKLVEVAKVIRDELGYNYLSSVTGVDYLKEGYLETVYHAFSIERSGGPFVFKARAPRDNPVIPSVTSIWRSADFQEREAYDMYGIKYEGHPDLRRILMWEGFEGYPLRKDWKEPYYEEEKKPFGSRWPGGHHVPAEERVAYHDNISVDPATFNPETYTPEAEQLLYTGITPIPDSGSVVEGIHTDAVVVNIGPQHPSTHGVFRMVVRLNGEQVEALKPVMGYLHRNHEKIGERNTYVQNMPYTDRLDYLCSMSNNFGYAVAVEKLTNVKPPERAEYIRVIMAELTRVMNHLAFCGFLTNEMGAFFTPFIYAF